MSIESGWIGQVGNTDRFATAAHFASYNGTAPIEASSGDRRRHRLNSRGNRQLNFAIHVAAVTQLRYPGAGRDYYDRKTRRDQAHQRTSPGR